MSNSELVRKYKVACSRTEEYLKTGEIFEQDIVHTIDATSEWKAVDELKHRIFYQAKKEGYSLKVNEPNLLIFIGSINIYMSDPPATIEKVYKFTDFKCTLTDC